MEHEVLRNAVSTAQQSLGEGDQRTAVFAHLLARAESDGQAPAGVGLPEDRMRKLIGQRFALLMLSRGMAVPPAILEAATANAAARDAHPPEARALITFLVHFRPSPRPPGGPATDGASPGPPSPSSHAVPSLSCAGSGLSQHPARSRAAGGRRELGR